MIRLADEIIAGKRLTRQDDFNCLVTADLKELMAGANKIREKLCGNKVDLCTIINGRAGKCSEDCKFCAQSVHNHTGCDTYEVLDIETVIADCKKNEKYGVHCYSIVTAGRSLTGEDFEKTIEIYKRLHEETNIKLCASHGMQTKEELERLKEAGVANYHENIETSKHNFPNVCTTHTYEDKVKEIIMAKEAGLHVCAGGIIGMGENWEDRIDMAVSLAELEITSIPINALMPIKGTPYGELERLSEEDILRTIAIFRYINPTAFVRMAAGRNYFADGGKKIFQAGANATITGNMLTTIGNDTKKDKEMFVQLGFTF